MQKLDNIYNAYSAEMELLLKNIAKIEESATKKYTSLQLNYINIISQMKESLNNLKEAIVEIDIKLNIVLLGKFKSGKSSFINKLVGKNIAAVDDAEMTYSLNYITYGENKQSRIIYKNDSYENYTYEELNKKLMTERNNEAFSEKIQHVECFYPYKELENINLWDTPGLGATNLENKLRAINIMGEADVVLWVMDGTAIGDVVDKDYINQLVTHNVPVICIVNKADRLLEYEDYKEQTIELLNSLYPQVFKETFFCCSLLDCDISLDKDLDKVREYLTTKIFRKKKEIILASSINKGINILQNIYDTLESYLQYLKEGKLRYDNYITSIKNSINKDIDELKTYINNYLDNHLLVEEFNQLLRVLETENINNREKAQEIIAQYINDRSLQKYLNEIESIVRRRFEDIWNKTIIETYENIYIEDKKFYLSNFYLVNEKNINDKTHQSLPLETTEALTSGAIGAIIALLVSGNIFGALLAGLGLAFMGFFRRKEPDTTIQSFAEIKKTELAEFRAQIKQEYLNNNLYPRINEAIKRIFIAAIKKAENEFMNSTNIGTMSEVISVIDGYLPDSDKFKELLNDELAKIDVEDLFISNGIKKDDFIILTANPNPGIEVLQRILSRATGYLYIVDPYFNDKSLGWLKYVNKDLSIKVILSSLDEDIENHSVFIEKLTQIRSLRIGSVLIRAIKYKHQKGSPLHDRFIFTSSYGLQLGNGLDAIGRKDISITFINEYKQFKERFFDSYWNATSVKYEDREKQVIKYDL